MGGGGEGGLSNNVDTTDLEVYGIIYDNQIGPGVYGNHLRQSDTTWCSRKYDSQTRPGVHGNTTIRQELEYTGI